MPNNTEFLNIYLPIILRIIKISLYFILIFTFFARARKEEEKPYFEMILGIFFIFMSIATITEILTQIFFSDFYKGITYWVYPTIYGQVLVYFFAFIGIALFTLGTEFKVKLKTYGLLSALSFALAIITLIIGMEIANYIYFLGLGIVIVPIVYFYIAFKATEETRTRAFVLAFGYLLYLIAEANNYYLIQRVHPLKELADYLESLFGFSVAFLGPTLSILSLILIFYGYKIFFK